MALAIEHVHNLPPHLSCVSTLPDTTQKLVRDIDELKQMLIDTWDCISQGIIAEVFSHANTAVCMCKYKGTSL